LDTKLKRYKISKMVAFILCVVLFIATLTSIAYINRPASILRSVSIDDVLLSKNYEESLGFQREYDRRVSQLLYMLDNFKSEDYIKSGETIHQGSLEWRIRDLFNEKYYNQENFHETYGDNYDVPIAREKFKDDFEEEIEGIKQNLIKNELRNFNDLKKSLEETKGFAYYISDGEYSITNQDVVDVNSFTKKPGFLIYENDTFIKEPASSNLRKTIENYDNILKDRLDSEFKPNLKLYMSFDSSFIDSKEAIFKSCKDELLLWLPIILVSGLITLVTLIYLIVVTGKKDEEGNRPVHKIDKVFTEISLLIILLAFFGGGTGFLMILTEGLNYLTYSELLYGEILLAIIIGLVSAAIGLLFVLSCVRNIKSGRFIKNSIIYICTKAIINSIKSIYHGGSVMTKIVLIALGISILSATVVGAVVAIILILIITPKWVKKYEEIKKGVNEVKNGNLTYKIPVTGDGELDELAKGINQISEASNIAVQNELKNQRLKTELISNVSHDLKTPLTSIISYIDLLKKEGLDSENAKTYLEVLDQKSMRLQKLTEDLFEAAKASSGAIPVKFEKVEMMSIINQGLAEMADRIEASGLNFKINGESDKYYVRADGKLLWRVLENLLCNVVKYAQRDSRVYIDIKELESKVLLEMKNISKDELNIDAEELLERFKQGDESRTTEGSGLGLAIAKDLVRLQNGEFEIKIDGDLFKAIVILPKY